MLRAPGLRRRHRAGQDMQESCTGCTGSTVFRENRALECVSPERLSMPMIRVRVPCHTCHTETLGMV